jgi:hypothetical protein
MGTFLVLLGIEQDVLYGLVYHVLRMPIQTLSVEKGGRLGSRAGGLGSV